MGHLTADGESFTRYANLRPLIEINLELAGYSIIEENVNGDSQFKLVKD